MDITWQTALTSSWLEATAQNRQPHAVMLAGPVGVGKRAAAVWMAAHKLGVGSFPLPQHPYTRPEHADLHWIAPAEDKASILIDQVRALVDDLSLTSYEGHGKVAVIEPAETMTANAANSLLKTLEEPPGDALLILVVDRRGRLPATIFSRCQRIEISVPTETSGLEWLNRLSPGDSWLEPLRMAGLAPLAAIRAAEQLDVSKALVRDFAAVAAGQASPIDVAARWAKLETPLVLEWLARTVAQACKSMLGGPSGARTAQIPESVLQRMDSRNLFCYLDIINRLRGQLKGSYNVQSTFEGLLIDWAAGLASLNRRDTPDGILLMQGGLSANEG